MVTGKIIIALALALKVSLLCLWWSVTSHADTRAELAAAERRIETLKTVMEAKREAENISDNDLADSISDVRQPR